MDSVLFPGRSGDGGSMTFLFSGDPRASHAARSWGNSENLLRLGCRAVGPCQNRHVRAARYCLFGSFVLDRLDERLWKGSMAVPLGNKAFAVLDRLTAQPNQLVTKDELL